MSCVALCIDYFVFKLFLTFTFYFLKMFSSREDCSSDYSTDLCRSIDLALKKHGHLMRVRKCDAKDII